MRAVSVPTRRTAWLRLAALVVGSGCALALTLATVCGLLLVLVSAVAP